MMVMFILKIVLDTIIWSLLYKCIKWFKYDCVINERGFNPSNKSINKPIRKNTISFGQMSKYALLVIPVIMSCVLCTFNLIFKLDIPTWTILRTYMYGCLLVGLVIGFSKARIGRLRPNFMVSNQIDHWTIVNYPYYNNYSLEHKIPLAKNDYEKKLRQESRKSFISGHACVGAYSAIFIVFLMGDYLPKSNLAIIIQLVISGLGLYPGLNQYLNYFHHLSDILAGYFVGITIAYAAYVHQLYLFRFI